MSTPSSSAIGIPIKAQQSILVSGRKPEGTAKKHVSIREEHEERELSDDGEDRRMNLNGSMFQFDDSDDEEDEEEDEFEEDDDTDEDEQDDDDMDEDEEDDSFDEDEKDYEELFAKASGRRRVDDEDELDEESREFLRTLKAGNKLGAGSQAAGRETEKKKKVKPIVLNLDVEEDADPQLSKGNEMGTPKGQTKKEKKATANDQKTPESQKKSPVEFKTPDQDIKIKTPSSVGNTPMKFVAKGTIRAGTFILMSRILRLHFVVLNHFITHLTFLCTSICRWSYGPGS